MPFQPVPGCIQVVVHGEVAGISNFENVYYLFLAGALTQGVADDQADFMAAAYSNLIPQLNSSVSYTGVTCTDMRTEGAPQFESASSFPVTGTGAGGALPLQSAALVSWKSSFRGAAGRGRTYLCGFDENASDGVNMDAGCIADVEAFIADMLTGAILRVVSRFKGMEDASSGSRRRKPIARDVAEVHTTSSGTVQDSWRTQRRRAAV